MGRALKYEIPGRDPRVSPGDVGARGWTAIFAEHGVAAPPIVLEIGFGRGEFLLGMASRAPATAFVGVEVSFKRTLKMARKVARAGLANVRLVEGRAEEVLPELFGQGLLGEIWINFSDPWPKSRHAHRRVVQPRLVAEAAQRLRAGGSLYIATDDVPYAHQIDQVLAGQKGLRNLYTPWPFLAEVPERPRTGYEEQWRAEGRPMHFFAYGVPEVGS
jgi:tRNA (guanine-N7-)-methyltransferase